MTSSRIFKELNRAEIDQVISNLYGSDTRITGCSLLTPISAIAFSCINCGSLGIAGVRGRYGGILVVPPPKYPHISSLPRQFPKTHVHIGSIFLVIMLLYLDLFSKNQIKSRKLDCFLLDLAFMNCYNEGSGYRPYSYMWSFLLAQKYK